MEHSTLLILAIALAANATAQTGTISGRVVDQNAKPVSGVAILYNRIPDLYRNGMGKPIAIPPFVNSEVTTDAQGTFQIAALPAGKYHLCAFTRTSGQISSCLYEPKPLVLSVSPEQQISGVELAVGSGFVVQVQVTDAAGHVRAGSPFAIGARAVGGPWSFFATLVSQAGQQLTYEMTLPRDYNFQLVVDTSLPVTGPTGATVVTKQPGALLNTSSASAVSAAFVVN